MKLKDIKTGGCYWTRGTRYENSIPVQIIEIIEVPNYSRCYGLLTSTTKKVRVHGLRLGDNGCLTVGKVEELMPGMIVSPADHEQILTRLVAARAERDATRENIRLAEEYGPAMVEALEAAGFAGAASDYRGLHFGRAAVAAWAEASFGGE